MLSFFVTLASSRNKAILYAGSRGWENYRFQASVWVTYHELLKRGFEKSDILLASYDDMAGHPYNPYKGKIFNDLDHKVNVYYGSDVIDYKDNITADTFSEMLEKINSTQDDNVFIYYVDHGNIGILGTPNEEYGPLYSDKVAIALEKLYNRNGFKFCFFAINSCNSGSVGQYVLDYFKMKNYNHLAIITSALANESSLSDLFDNWLFNSISDEFTVGFIGKIRMNPDCTLSELHDYMISSTKYSRPDYFESDEMKNMKISDFIGTTTSEQVKTDQSSSLISHDKAKLMIKEYIMNQNLKSKDKMKINEEYEKEKTAKAKLIEILDKISHKIPQSMIIKSDEPIQENNIIVTDDYLEVIKYFTKKFGYIRTDDFSIFCQFFYGLTKQTRKEIIIHAIDEVI